LRGEKKKESANGCPILNITGEGALHPGLLKVNKQWEKTIGLAR